MADLGQANLRNPWHPCCLVHVFTRKNVRARGPHVPRIGGLGGCAVMRLNTPTTGKNVEAQSGERQNGRRFAGRSEVLQKDYNQWGP